MMDGHVLVIGASNMDISATSNDVLVFHDSNPGEIETSFGGVGRNVAENLACLQKNVQLLTAYGDDRFSTLLEDSAKEAGFYCNHSLKRTNAASSLYICVNRPDGEMAVAVSDMRVCDFLTPAFMEEKLPEINRASYVVLDTNLPEETLVYLAQHVTAPLFTDTVSTTKAIKLRPILSHFAGIKSNRQEASLLTGLCIEENEDARLAADTLHKMGIQYVMLTLSTKGALISDGKTIELMPPMTTQPVNTTGCGDAFFAGALYALMDGGGCRQMLQYGLGMAALCATSPHAVASGTSPKRLLSYLEKYDENEAKKQ